MTVSIANIIPLLNRKKLPNLLVSVNDTLEHSPVEWIRFHILYLICISTLNDLCSRSPEFLQNTFNENIFLC